MQTVAVVGASPKEDRYSYKAMQMLTEKGHQAIPVAPGKSEILNKKCYASLADITEKIDTVTMYVGSARQTDIIKDICAIKPQRVIFNPGTENPDVYPKLQALGINVQIACTLVLLSTGQF